MTKTAISLLAALAVTAAMPAADVQVTDASIVGSTTWTKNNTYILNGLVFVENGETLTIEPGTVVKAKPGTGAAASALLVARGGKIFANGTASEPVVFTAEADNLNGNLGKDDRGLWGGVVLLGRARINTASGQGNIEGIPTTEVRGIYGGTDDDDSSGSMRYVSIRHGGSVIGANNELNGLSLGAVGRGTTLEYIEVFANADDGFEFFGGTANAKYLVSAFNDDDGFDWDEGFRGKLQFLFHLQDSAVGNQALECDGGTTPEDGQPFARPTIYNLTSIGSGAASSNSLSNGPIFRDNTGGFIFNSIFHDFKGYAFRIETESAQAEDSAKRLAAGDTRIANNIFGTFGAGAGNDQLFIAPNVTSGGPAPASNYTAAHIAAVAQGNRLNTDPKIRAISRTKNATLDPRLAPDSPALTGAAAAPNDGFFTVAPYVGAFSPGANWAYSWTKLGRDGYFSAAGNTPSSTLLNISTRATIGGSTVAFPGFVIGGDRGQTVLIRAVGPGLAAFPGVTPAADPVLELYNGANQKIADADDWSNALFAEVATRVGAFPLPAGGSKDAVLIASLPPGNYSAIVRAKAGTAGGEVIIEVYTVE
jgi:hypothetical protein